MKKVCQFCGAEVVESQQKCIMCKTWLDEDNIVSDIPPIHPNRRPSDIHGMDRAARLTEIDPSRFFPRN
ncbi:MAG: hypothetical protein ABIH21_05100 [Patescibacteria group bacterium]